MKAKIDRVQFFFIIPNIVYGKAIGLTAGVTVRAVGGDVWISMAIAFITGTIIIAVLTLLGNKFPEKTIIQYSEELLGKFFSKLLGLILGVYFGIAFTDSVNVIGFHLKEYLLPETPYFILCLLYGILCVYAVKLGVEVVIRFAIFGFFMNMFINITMILGTIADFQLINLLPLFDRGVITDIKGSVYTFSDVTKALLSIAMIYPMLNNKKKAGIISTSSMLLAGLIVVSWPFFETGVLGADVMKQFVLVCMQQVRSAELTRYLPRYELIMVSFFVWSVVVQSTILLYCSQYSFKQVFGIKNDWIILLILAVILIPFSSSRGFDHNKFVQFVSSPWSQISFGLGTGIPLLMLAAAILKGKFRKKASNQQNGK